MWLHNSLCFLPQYVQFKTQFQGETELRLQISSLKEANLTFISHSALGFIVCFQIAKTIRNSLVQIQGKLKHCNMKLLCLDHFSYEQAF